MGRVSLGEAAVDELAHLLVNTTPRRDAEQRSGSRGAISTVRGCPALNDAVRSASGLGESWTDEMTWRLVQAEVESVDDERGMRTALKALLAMGPFAGQGKDQRRRAAIDALGETVGPGAIRLRRIGGRLRPSGGVLIGIHRVLRRRLEDALSAGPTVRVNADRAPAESLPFRQAGARRAIRRIERFPVVHSGYPERMTTSNLAGRLSFEKHSDPPPPQVVDGVRVPVLPSPFDAKQLKELVSLSLEPGGRVLLTGMPGSGKSTLARAMVSSRLDSVGVGPTLYAWAPHLATLFGDRSPLDSSVLLGLVARAFEGAFGVVFEDETPDWQALVSNPHLAVIIDGADEVPRSSFVAFREAIEELSAEIRGAILIASRPGVALTKGWAEYKMLAPGDPRGFIDSWFAGESEHPGRARALKALGNPNFAQIGSSPLLLGFLAQVSEHGAGFESTSELFDQYVALTLQRDWKDQGGEQIDDVELYRRARLGRRVAWLMSRGDTAPDGVRGWQNEVTPARLLDLFPEPEHDRVLALVSLESLFVTAAQAASRIHTTFGWTHRTLQEHLVGTYMADMLRKGELAQDEILALLMGEDDWSVTLSHTVASLNDLERRQLVEHLWSNGGTRLDRLAVLTIVRDVVGMSEGRADLLADLIDRATGADLRDLLRIAPRRSILEALDRRIGTLDRVDPQDLFDMVNAMDESQDRGDLERIGRALSADLPDSALSMLGIALRMETTPANALEAYFELIRRGESWVLDVEAPLLSPDEARKLMAGIARLDSPDPEWRAVLSVVALADEDARAIVRDTRPDTFAAAELALAIADEAPLRQVGIPSRLRVPDARHRDTILRALAGEFGDGFAYVIATRLAPGIRLDNVDMVAWARVGALVRDLATGRSVDGDGSVDPSPLEFEDAWRFDPDTMIRYLRKLHLERRASSRSLDASLINLHRALGPAGPPAAMQAGSFVPAIDLNDMVGSYFARLRIDRILDALTATAADSWSEFAGLIPVLRDAWAAGYWTLPDEYDDHSTEERGSLMFFLPIERFQRVVNWGASAKLPVMRSLTSLHLRGVSIEKALDGVNANALSIRGNQDAIDEWMVRDWGIRSWRHSRSRVLPPM